MPRRSVSRDGEVHGYFDGKTARFGFESRKAVNEDSSRNVFRGGESANSGGVNGLVLGVCAEEREAQEVKEGKEVEDRFDEFVAW